MRIQHTALILAVVSWPAHSQSGPAITLRVVNEAGVAPAASAAGQ